VLPNRSSRRKLEAELKEKAPMCIARIAFGCAVDNYGEKIYACGGTISGQTPTDVCEVYSVNENTWSLLPKLNDARFS